MLYYGALYETFKACFTAGSLSHRWKGHAKPVSTLHGAPNPGGPVVDSPEVECHFDESDPLPWLTQVWTTLAPKTHEEFEI